MNDLLKKIIAIGSAGIILAIAFYGSYLPMRKSQLFIETTRSLDDLKTFKDFTERLSVPLDYYSPIGQEELVRNFGSIVLSIVKNNGQNAGLAQASLSFLRRYYDPLTVKDRGLSFGQDLYILGLIHETAYLQTKDARYLDQAKEYFERAYRLAPKRPQPLYGLFDVYRIEKDYVHAKAIGDQILSQWPDDKGTRESYDKLLGQMQATSSEATSS